jgi:hypothetical protein
MIGQAGFFMRGDNGMLTDGEFLLCFPCYIIKRTDDKVFGYQSGGIHGLPIFTVREAATEAIGVTPGLLLHEFPTSAELLAYLRGLTGDINHVVLDPLDGKQAGFVRLPVFIQALAAAEPA